MGVIKILQGSLTHHSHHNIDTLTIISPKKHLLSIIGLMGAVTVNQCNNLHVKNPEICIYRVVRSVMVYWVNNLRTKSP